MAFLKKPGDLVKRDEPIYQMETDKAVMDVESPYEGTLVEWLAHPDEILAIGADVGRIDAVGEVQEMTVHGAPPASSGPVAAPESSGGSASRLAGVPPRTRAYAKEKGIADDELANVPSAGSKLMPSDIDAYLLGGPSATKTREDGKNYSEQPISQKQRLLNSRLVRGSQVVVPGTMSMVLDWDPMEHVRDRVKASGSDFQPSVFTMFAYCVAQALRDFPIFRSTLVGDETLRTYKTASLGIAVSLPGDELVVALVEEADALDFRTFAQRTRERIDLARTGRDQANEAMTISLTNMQNFGIRDAIPVVVPPAVATLFLGEVYTVQDLDTPERSLSRRANMALTFDHRVANGVGAAEFMKAIKQKVETVGAIVGV